MNLLFFAAAAAAPFPIQNVPQIGSDLVPLYLETSSEVATEGSLKAASSSPFADAVALEDEQLVAQNGREDLAQVSRNEQVASSSHNSVSGTSQTGTVTFSDQAFQNVSGLTIVNANSGNNVAMNAAMNVNISINPGP